MKVMVDSNRRQVERGNKFDFLRVNEASTKIWMLATLLALALSLVPACGGGSGGHSVVSVEPLASGEITAAGGLIEVINPQSALFGLRLEVPAGALTSPTVIEVFDASPAALGSGGDSVGSAARFEPSGLQFQIPAILTLPYPDEDDDGVVDSVNRLATLLECVSNDESGWETLSVVSRDTVAKTVSAEVAHFSIFQLQSPKYITSGPIRFWIHSTPPGLTQGQAILANNTVRDALMNGAWSSLLACQGWNLIEVSDKESADIAFSWDNLGAGLLGQTRRTSVAGVLNETEVVFNSYHLNSGGITWELGLTPPASCGTNPSNQVCAWDLYSTVLHEFAHTIGLPGDHMNSNPPHDANCVPVAFDPDAIILNMGYPQVRRTLTALDEAFFVEVHPVHFFSLHPQGQTVGDMEPIRFSAEATCGQHSLVAGSVVAEIKLTDGSKLQLSPSDFGITMTTPGIFEFTHVPTNPLPSGPVTITAFLKNDCGSIGQIQWMFLVAGDPLDGSFSGTYSLTIPPVQGCPGVTDNGSMVLDLVQSNQSVTGLASLTNLSVFMIGATCTQAGTTNLANVPVTGSLSGNQFIGTLHLTDPSSGLSADLDFTALLSLDGTTLAGSFDLFTSNFSLASQN